MRCRWAELCPFFQEHIPYSPETKAILLARYCHGAYTSCARWIGWRIFGIEGVPEDMLPSDHTALDEMLVERFGHDEKPQDLEG